MSQIFHIATSADWDRAQARGIYDADTLAAEGFIHCSTTRQVIEVANRLFRDRHDLVLLCIDRAKVSAEIRDENCEDEDTLYPHIYGALNMDAVVKAHEFLPNQDGSFDLPEALRELPG